MKTMEAKRARFEYLWGHCLRRLEGTHPEYSLRNYKERRATFFKNNTRTTVMFMIVKAIPLKLMLQNHLCGNWG